MSSPPGKVVADEVTKIADDVAPSTDVESQPTSIPEVAKFVTSGNANNTCNTATVHSASSNNAVATKVVAPPPPFISQAEKDLRQHMNLKAMQAKEKKFSSRCRLFFGNVPMQSTDEELIALFQQFGETKELYVNRERGWGFIKMDYKINAEVAKTTLDNFPYRGRNLRVKFASHGSAVEVHGLCPATSNELLAKGFSMFGEVERATVICDMKGNSKGYGVVEFGWKKPAQVANAKINEGFFVLGRTPKPLTCKIHDQSDDTEGIREKDLQRSPNLPREREYMPRFVMADSAEYPWCEKWKAYEALAKEKRAKVEDELKEIRKQLEMETESVLLKHENDMKRLDMLQRNEEAHIREEMRKREELLRHELYLQRQRELEIRGQDNTGARDDLRQQEEFRRQEEFIRMQQIDLDMRKRQAAPDMFMDANLRQAVPPPAGAQRNHEYPNGPPGDRLHQMPMMPAGGIPGLGPSLGLPSPRMSQPLGGLAPRRDMPPPRLDGFFDGKRPRMF